MSETCSIEPLSPTLCAVCGSVRGVQKTWFASIGDYRYSYDHFAPSDCVRFLSARLNRLEKRLNTGQEG